MGATILIVDDEAAIRRFLRISLEAHGYGVRETRTGEDALALCATEAPDLVVLDLGLPGIDGMTVIERLREWTAIPILVLSVRSSEREKVAALDAGANDYLTKPFGVSEFLARCRVLLRTRPQVAEEPVLECGDVRIDRHRRRVTVAGREVRFSPKEYAGLLALAARRGQIVTHATLLREIWGESHTGDTHYLRVLIRNLRRKLSDSSTRPRYIATEQGIGYRFVDS